MNTYKLVDPIANWRAPDFNRLLLLYAEQVQETAPNATVLRRGKTHSILRLDDGTLVSCRNDQYT